MRQITIAFLLLLFLSSIALADTLRGKVIRVADGDTITVLDQDKQQHKIRLLGIDAPESKQAFGTRARQKMQELVDGQQVRIEWKERDRYQRILGDVYVTPAGKDELWVNVEMVKSGLAWHFVKYDDRKPLADAENTAREEKAGLWADKEPTPPWEYRKTERGRNKK